MRHFQLIAEGVDVAPLVGQIEAQPHLWDENPLRRISPGTPHSDMRDIWVRYNDVNKFRDGDFSRLNDEHIPIWYPAYYALPALKPILFPLMAAVHGEMLGGVLITRIPDGCGIDPHADDSWHVHHYPTKFYVALKSTPGADFVCHTNEGDERLNPRPGDIHLFDNRKRHSVVNRSGSDRWTLIVCIRTALFGDPT